MSKSELSSEEITKLTEFRGKTFQWFEIGIHPGRLMKLVDLGYIEVVGRKKNRLLYKVKK